MEKNYIRKCECNRCGDCCVAPWPKSYRHGRDKWELADVERSWPQHKLFPLPAFGGPLANTIVVGNIEIGYEWQDDGLYKITDSGACTDCPLLLGKTGDDVRPCALIGTEHEYMWTQRCEPTPDMRKTEKEVGDWYEYCPNCSYIYEEE